MVQSKKISVKGTESQLKLFMQAAQDIGRLFVEEATAALGSTLVDQTAPHQR